VSAPVWLSGTGPVSGPVLFTFGAPGKDTEDDPGGDSSGDPPK